MIVSDSADEVSEKIKEVLEKIGSMLYSEIEKSFVYEHDFYLILSCADKKSGINCLLSNRNRGDLIDIMRDKLKELEELGVQGSTLYEVEVDGIEIH